MHTAAVRTTLAFAAAAAVAAMSLAPTMAAAAAAQATRLSCNQLTSVNLPNTTIRSASAVAAGAFTRPGAAPQGAGPRFDDLPAFCRVEATIRPVANSTINVEIWLPENWNGTFQGIANGLWAGIIDHNGLANALRAGAATATSDAGHTSTATNVPPTTWYNWETNREQIIDFDWRGLHETTLQAKALIGSYYTAPLTLSYLIHPNGGGSRQSMREVQRFPEDYDAVVAGGLASFQTHHALGQLWVWQATHKTPAHYIEPEKYPAIHAAALDACDMKDGVKDGVILDPPDCRFDPNVLACPAGTDAVTCLVPQEVEAARQIYTEPKTADTNERIFGALMPGSELDWANMAGPQPYQFGTQILAYLVFKQGAQWDPRTLKFDKATVARVDAPEIQPMNAFEPDISRFVARGGKLLLVGGWNDTLIAPGVNVDYYEAVMKALGPRARDSVRLFMVPGMGHSPGRAGARAYDIDLINTIKQWKATNVAPDSLVFTYYANGIEQHQVAVCAYPRLATYSGRGDTKDPANYSCRERT